MIVILHKRINCIVGMAERNMTTCLERKIDSLISQYAHNRIDTAELKAALQAISYFPGQSVPLGKCSSYSGTIGSVKGIICKRVVR